MCRLKGHTSRITTVTKEDAMLRLLILWVINAAALMLIPYLTESVYVADLPSALIAAAVLGFVNTMIRPVLMLLTLPVTFLTMGLFLFVINGLTFWAVAQMVSGFHVASFWSAIWGALLYSIATWALTTLIMKE